MQIARVVRSAFSAVIVLSAIPATAGEWKTAATEIRTPQGDLYAGTPTCAQYKQSAMRMACEVSESEKRAAKYRSEGEQADLRAACSQFLMDGVKAQLFTKEQVIAAYGGKVTKEIITAKGCEVARSFGFLGKRATLETLPQ